MTNVLLKDKQIAVLSSLCEGSSIRAIERQTDIHRDTIMRLGVRIGQGCKRLMDAKMRDLECARLERTVCDGVVEVFELIEHPTATRLYAWSHETDDPEHPRRHVTVLHSHPVTSPVAAVRAFIIQEFNTNAPAET